MNRPDETTLAQALRAAATQLQAQQPPPQLRERVLAALPAGVAPPRRRGFGPAGVRAPALWAGWGAVACAFVLLGSALLMLQPPLPPQADDGLRLGTAGFFPLVPPERWPREAALAWLVRTELPGERLAALGLPYDPARAGASVRAELLLHPSGEVLAVRFVQ